jgi:hypothetical protein
MLYGTNTVVAHEPCMWCQFLFLFLDKGNAWLPSSLNSKIMHTTTNRCDRQAPIYTKWGKQKKFM